MDTQDLIQYEPLAKEFEGRASQRGWLFREVKREGLIAMYEKVSVDGSVYFEVIRVKRDKGGVSVIGGVEINFESKERYPNDNAFGTDGWCYRGYDRACERYDELLAVKSSV